MFNMSLYSQNISNNPLSIDGLVTINADQIFINGVAVSAGDNSQLVPYKYATGAVDLGTNTIQTTYVPTDAADLTNKKYVDTKVLNPVCESFKFKSQLGGGLIAYKIGVDADNTIIYNNPDDFSPYVTYTSLETYNYLTSSNIGTYLIKGDTGSQGIQGIQGPSGVGTQGIQGVKGDTGLQGIQGPDGVGTQGIQGVKGDTGLQGIQGASGVGTQGIGIQGIQGVKGDTGLQGIQGDTGSQGIQGIQGPSGVGTQGIQGIKGDTGLQGIQGPDGIGTQGIQGFKGDTGLQGIQGFKGDTGLQGIQGASGVGTQGIQGFKGDTGLQGIQGIKGDTGLQGIQGPSGVGTQGIQGIQGIQGFTGPSGTSSSSLQSTYNTNYTCFIPFVTSNAAGTFTPYVTQNNQITLNPYTGTISALHFTGALTAQSLTFSTIPATGTVSSYLALDLAGNTITTSGPSSLNYLPMTDIYGNVFFTTYSFKGNYNFTINAMTTMNYELICKGTGTGQMRCCMSETTGYGVIFRNDGANFYILLTANNSPLGGWRDPERPFYIDLTNGVLHSGSGQNFTGGLNAASINNTSVQLMIGDGANGQINFNRTGGNDYITANSSGMYFQWGYTDKLILNNSGLFIPNGQNLTFQGTDSIKLAGGINWWIAGTAIGYFDNGGYNDWRIHATNALVLGSGGLTSITAGGNIILQPVSARNALRNFANWAVAGHTTVILNTTYGIYEYGIGLGIDGTTNQCRITCLSPSRLWLECWYNASIHVFMVYGDTYCCYINASGVTLLSDGREKQNIKPLKTNRSLERIMKCKTVTYNRIMDKTDPLIPVEAHDKFYVGLIAQDVLEFNPHCVSTEINDRYAIQYNDFVVHLIGAVQEQQGQINKQQDQIDILMAHITTLTTQVNLLTATIQK